MRKPVKMLDMGLHTLNHVTAINATERMRAVDVKPVPRANPVTSSSYKGLPASFSKRPVDYVVAD